MLPLLLVAATVASADAPAADTPLVTLADGDFAASDLACPANGQAIYCLDPRTGAVQAVEPRARTPRRVVIAAPPAGAPRPVAIGCIDTNTLVALCRGDTAWSLRTWRLQPEAAVDFSMPVQETAVGEAAVSAAPAHLLVGPSRDWLLLAGLPPPSPPLMRGAIAGARIGRVSDRSCPAVGDDGRVLAVTANRRDETVLFVARGAVPARLSFHDLSGRLLLDLDGTLPAIRDAACCGPDGTLWAIGGDGSATHPEGLWRIDAALAGGRQVVRPVCVARLAAPQAVACVSHTAVIVAHGARGRPLVRLDLPPRPQAAAATDPGADP
jgi:hypothetical protein